MRVGVHAGQLLQPVPGGIGRYVTKLLGALGSAGVETVAFAAGPAPESIDDLIDAWVDIGFPRGSWRYELWHHFRRPLVRLDSDIDVLHAPSLAIPPKGKLPLVVTVHDLVFLDHSDYLTPRGVSFHKRALNIARDEASAFIVPSHWVARRLEDCDVESTRIHVAHHGVDLVDPSVASESSRNDLPDSFILFVGTIEPRKGINDLLVAITKVRESHQNLHLVLAGPKGWGALPDFSAPHIHWLGGVDDETLDHLYRHALGLVLPSRDEGFGLPLVEAMARGCPVIASDAACLPEIVQDGGVITPLGNIEALSVAIEQLQDPAQRDPLTQRALARARAFTWHSSAAAHVVAYRSAMACQ